MNDISSLAGQSDFVLLMLALGAVMPPIISLAMRWTGWRKSLLVVLTSIVAGVLSLLSLHMLTWDNILRASFLVGAASVIIYNLFWKKSEVTAKLEGAGKGNSNPPPNNPSEG